jgi:hypothetical protein
MGDENPFRQSLEGNVGGNDNSAPPTDAWHRLPQVGSHESAAVNAASSDLSPSATAPAQSVDDMFHMEDAAVANGTSADVSAHVAADATQAKQQETSPASEKATVVELQSPASPTPISSHDSDASRSRVETVKESVHAAFSGLLTGDSNEQASFTDADSAQPGEFSLPEGSNEARPLDAIGAGESFVGGEPPGSPLNRPKIIYHPVGFGIDSNGRKMLRPDVRLAYDAEVTDGSSQVQQVQAEQIMDLPAPNPAPETAYPIEGQWMPPVVVDGMGYDQACPECENYGDGWGHMSHRHGKRCYTQGIGPEYVMHAPFFLDRTQPFNHCYVRGDAASDLEFPDRIEYFWAKSVNGGKGPQSALGGEPSVNYQDAVFYIEKGTDRLSLGTKLPIRVVDPEFRPNTAGFADMELIQRAVLLDGTCWQLTQLFITHFPTGSAHRGTGDGHFSLEPGVAWRYKWSDYTYINGDLTYWFPIAADLDYGGQMFNYGIGISHVWIDTDKHAIIPTLEIEAWTILDGQQTLPGLYPDPTDITPPIALVALSEEIDSMGIVNICPGLRWVCDPGCDCGVREFGISGGVCVTEDRWYEEILRIEFRWSR